MFLHSEELESSVGMKAVAVGWIQPYVEQTRRTQVVLNRNTTVSIKPVSIKSI